MQGPERARYAAAVAETGRNNLYSGVCRKVGIQHQREGVAVDCTHRFSKAAVDVQVEDLNNLF
jgi:hypothetical protein